MTLQLGVTDLLNDPREDPISVISASGWDVTAAALHGVVSKRPTVTC